jgi:hypothetical protein
MMMRLMGKAGGEADALFDNNSVVLGRGDEVVVKDGLLGRKGGTSIPSA